MRSFTLRLRSATSALAAVACLSSIAHAQGNSANAPGQNKAEFIPAAHHDHTFVLRNAPGKPNDTSVVKEPKTSVACRTKTQWMSMTTKRRNTVTSRRLLR